MATPDSDRDQHPLSGSHQQAADLEATQQLLRATLDASLDMIQVFEAIRNQQGDIIDFTWILNNHASEKIYGNVIGQRLLKLQPGVVEEGIFAAFKRVVETGQPQQYEKHYVHEQFDGWFFQSVVKLGDGVATTTTDITGRKNAEQALQQSKALLQDVIDGPNIGIAVYKALRNNQGQIIDFVHEYINRASLAMLGGEDFTGKLFTDHGQNGIVQLPQLIDVMETGMRNSYLREAHFRGRQVWFAITNSPLDSDRLVHTWEDVTQRYKAEQESKEQAHFIQRVTQMMPDVVSVVEFPSRTILYTNRDTLTWVGFDADELSRMSFDDRIQLFHPEDLPAIQAFYGRFTSLKDRQETSVEYRLKNKQGDWILLSLRGQVFRRDEQGHPTQLLFVGQNITAQRQAEQDILRLKDEVAQAATDKYRSLFESIDEGFCIVEVILDENGQPFDLLHLEANPAYERYTGLRGIVGKRSREIIPEAGPWLDFYGQVALTGQAARNESYLVAPIDRWIAASASRIGGEGSLKVAIVFNDITERKRRERQQAFLLTFSDVLRTLGDQKTIEETGLQLLAEFLGLDRAYVFVLYPAQDRAVVRSEQRHPTLPSIVGEVRMSDFPQTVRQIENQTIVFQDIDNDTRLSDLNRTSLHAVNLQSFVCASVRKGERNVIWSIAAVSATPRTWTKPEIELIEIVAERIWAAVERAKAEEALRQLEKRFESIANLVPDLLWESWPDGSTNWYNQRWLDYTGQTFEEAIGWGWAEAIHPDDRAASARRYDQAVEAGKSLRQEHRIRRHDGEYRWFVVSTSPLTNERGQVVKMYGAATDIHESKQAEEGLMQREAELARVQQIGRIGGVDIDVANQLTGKRSPEYLKLHGLPADTPSETHADWLNRLHPDDREQAQQTLLRALEGDQSSYESEYRIIRPKDGELVWIYAKLDIERNGEGEPVRLVGVHIDITRRKRAEEALRRLEQRNRLAIEAAELATWEWDLVRDEVYWNEQHFHLLGMAVRPNPLPAQAFISHLHPEDAEAIKAQLKAAIEQRTLYDAEFRVVREDGVVRWMSGYGQVTGEKEGQPLRASGVMMDITERKEAEQALQEADRRKDEFLAMLAHELRNPMSTIRSGLQILNVVGAKDQISSDAVAMMNRQTEHLVHMVDDLLDVSRISQGKIELKKAQVNLVEIVRQAADSVRSLYQEQGKRLQVDLPQSPIYLQGDATRLTQVVANLLTNGARYTGEQGQVWVNLSHQQEAILLVKDNGIGLTPDQLTAIFELFVQVDNSVARSKGGLGLGLTLVKRLVEMHGGRVEARSEGLGRGSTFTVHLPTPTVVAESPATTPSEAGDSATIRRIVVIDDNADAAMTLGMLLKLKGFEAHTRTSGKAGIEAAESLQPGAILLDIGMPGMDGYETCRLIREQSWGRDVVVIALTGYGQEEDQQRTREAGFDGHLVKPVDLETLLDLLTDLLDKNAKK